MSLYVCRLRVNKFSSPQSKQLRAHYIAIILTRKAEPCLDSCWRRWVLPAGPIERVNQGWFCKEPNAQIQHGLPKKIEYTTLASDLGGVRHFLLMVVYHQHSIYVSSSLFFPTVAVYCGTCVFVCYYFFIGVAFLVNQCEPRK